MKEIIWTFAPRSLENQIFTSGWLHPEWSEGNPAFSRRRPSLASLSSSAVSVCPLCLRRWLRNCSRESHCGLGQFLKVSSRRERVSLSLFFPSSCVWQRGLWEPFLLQQLFNSPLLKCLSVCSAEKEVSAEAVWNDFRKAETVVECYSVPDTPYIQLQGIPLVLLLFKSYKDLQIRSLCNST